MSTLIRVDRNGTEYHEGKVTCERCGGLGVISGYKHVFGGVCFECNGDGVVNKTWKVYTPEHAEKLRLKKELRDTEKATILRKKIDVEELIESAKREQREKESAEQDRLHKEKLSTLAYVGEIGEKLELDVTYTNRYDYKNVFGTVNIFKFKDELGNVLVWKTSSWLEILVDGYFESIQLDSKIRIKATIKEHEEYNGEKQTLIVRVKVLKVYGAESDED